MVMQAERRPILPQQEQPDRTADGYRERAQRLAGLARFLEANPDPSQLDSDTKREMRAVYGDTMKSLVAAMDSVEWLKGLQPKEAAAQLVQYFSDKADALDRQALADRGIKELPTVRVTERRTVAHPRDSGEVVQLPKLGNREWEIIRVNVGDRQYYIADPRDRRAVSDIVGDINAGKPVGYKVGWDELEAMVA